MDPCSLYGIRMYMGRTYGSHMAPGSRADWEGASPGRASENKMNATSAVRGDAPHYVHESVRSKGALGAVFSIIAYTTHYWIQSFTERRTGVDSMGLWEICFGQDFAAPWHVNDELGRRYADCNWLLSYELRTLQKWLFSGWFIIVEVMITAALVLQLLGIIFGLVYVVRGCAINRERYMLLTAAICEFSAGAFIATGTLVYAYYSLIDQYWLPSPESNYLSWSYGLAVVGGLAAIVAGTFHMIDYCRLKMVFDLQTRAATYAPSLSNRAGTALLR